MGMKVVCRYCKSKIKKKDALQIPGEKNNTYFCNQECCSNYFAEMEKAKNKNEAVKKARELERLAKKQEKEEYAKEKAEYDEIFEETKVIFGYEFQGYGILKREVKNWEKLADRKKILSYLKENEDFLSSTLARKEFANDFNRVRYYSVIVSSKLHDYRGRPPVVDDSMSKEVVEDTDYIMPINKKKKIERRKGFGE